MTEICAPTESLSEMREHRRVKHTDSIRTESCCSGHYSHLSLGTTSCQGLCIYSKKQIPSCHSKYIKFNDSSTGDQSFRGDQVCEDHQSQGLTTQQTHPKPCQKWGARTKWKSFPVPWQPTQPNIVCQCDCQGNQVPLRWPETHQQSLQLLDCVIVQL